MATRVQRLIIVREADQMLYEVKRAGRNLVKVSFPSKHEREQRYINRKLASRKRMPSCLSQIQPANGLGPFGRS